jgi:hypothetical protein
MKFRVDTTDRKASFYVNFKNGKPKCSCQLSPRCYHEIVASKIIDLNSNSSDKNCNINKLSKKMNAVQFNSKKKDLKLKSPESKLSNPKD